MDVETEGASWVWRAIARDPEAAFLIWILPGVIVWGNLQAAKVSRARAGAGKLSILALRLLHTLFTIPVAFVFAYGVKHWPPEEALNASIASGLAAPVMLYAVLRVLKRRDPQSARDLAGGDELPTELGGVSAKGDEDAGK